MMNTPLTTVEGIYVKFEPYNVTGSIKDRMASYMVDQAKKRGELKPKSKILEVTSGNTGIAFSAISAKEGYHFIAIMPESMSIERRKMMQAFGAELVLTPAKEDMAGAIKKYTELKLQYPDAWLPEQFENQDNIDAHRFGIGQEILHQFMHYIPKQEKSAFVAGVGTGGTLLGTTLALKEKWPQMKIVAVEPSESAVLSGRDPGYHRIQGIGEGFIPDLVQRNRDLIDRVIMVKSKDAIVESKRLAREHGLLVGISSGANLIAAKRLQKQGYYPVITVFADRGERYLSSVF